MSRFKAVSFDAGGTLFHMGRPVGEVYSEFASRYGRKTDPRILEDEFRRLFNLRSADSADAGHLTPQDERKWWKSLVHELFHGGGETMADFDRFFDELHEYFAQPDLWKMYPDAGDTLEQLHRAGIKMAIVSNWDSRLPQLVSRMGVDRYMEAVVVSALEKTSKPDQRIFRIALEKLGMTGGEVVHVGDSLRDDINGALGAGMGAIWLRRPGEGHDADSGGKTAVSGSHYEVRDLAGAVRIILGS